MGAEVITSIVRDSRRTGPRGTPSAINTCLGRVLFRKIQDSDVVMSLITPRTDELKYMTGSGRSHAAVLTADKKHDLRLPQRGNGRVAKGLPLDSRLESTHDDFRNTRREFAKQDLAMCEE